MIFKRIFERKLILVGSLIKNVTLLPAPNKTADKLGSAGGQINAGKFSYRPILKGSFAIYMLINPGFSVSAHWRSGME